MTPPSNSRHSLGSPDPDGPGNPPPAEVASRRRGARAARSRTDVIPLDRIIRIAEFRARLRSFLRHSERICRNWGLTPQRYLLLLMIKGAPDRSKRASFTDIAERLRLERNTVTELVGRAEQAGLIEREPSTLDQRVVYLRLTAEGDRRLCGALLDSDRIRHELLRSFEALSDAIKTALKRTRQRPS